MSSTDNNAGFSGTWQADAMHHALADLRGEVIDLIAEFEIRMADLTWHAHHAGQKDLLPVAIEKAAEEHAAKIRTVYQRYGVRMGRVWFDG